MEGKFPKVARRRKRLLLFGQIIQDFAPAQRNNALALRLGEIS
jgi:hypothetical protein